MRSSFYLIDIDFSRRENKGIAGLKIRFGTAGDRPFIVSEIDILDTELRMLLFKKRGIGQEPFFRFQAGFIIQSMVKKIGGTAAVDVPSGQRGDGVVMVARREKERIRRSIFADIRSSGHIPLRE